MLKTEDTLKGNLKSPDEARRIMEWYAHHPIIFVLIALIFILYLVGTIPPTVREMGSFFYGLFLSVLLLIFIYLAPRPVAFLIRFGLARNIPFIVVNTAFFMFFSWSELFVYYIIGLEGFTLERLLKGCMQRFCLMVPFHIFFTAFVESKLREGLGKSPKLIPIFKPVSLSIARGISASVLDEKLRGEIISISAANQYVNVNTDDGEHLLRMTLKEAIDMLPPHGGYRIHRSWWISAHILVDAEIIESGKALKTLSNLEYPIGKTRLDGVKATLARLSTKSRIDKLLDGNTPIFSGVCK